MSRTIRISGIFLTVIIAFSILTNCGSEGDFPVLNGKYMGQPPPGDKPELFAPGIITTGMYTRDIAMTPDGTEIYFCISIGRYAYAKILVTKLINGRWTQPEVAPFSTNPDYMDIEPFISPDGKRFYFLSTRPDIEAGETEGDQDIWVMDRIGNTWSEPYNLGDPVCSDSPEFFPSVTNDGTIYFTRNESPRQSFIYRARLVDGKYAEPERLPEQVNCGPTHYNAFIAPDESYIINCIPGREDSYGGTDYYIIFRNEDDTWSEPINMGDKVNTAGTTEYSPYVTPDGKYFFFMSSRLKPESERETEHITFSYLKKTFNEPQNGNSDIYWMSASFIEELRPEK